MADSINYGIPEFTWPWPSARAAADYCREIANFLRAHPNAWTKHFSARGPGGIPCDPRDSLARAWCALGLLERFIPRRSTRNEAVGLLGRALPDSALKVVYEYNDRETTTLADIIALFERAAGLNSTPTYPNWNELASAINPVEVMEIEALNAAIAKKLIPWDQIMSQIQNSVAA